MHFSLLPLELAIKVARQLDFVTLVSFRSSSRLGFHAANAAAEDLFLRSYEESCRLARLAPSELSQRVVRLVLDFPPGDVGWPAEFGRGRARDIRSRSDDGPSRGNTSNQFHDGDVPWVVNGLTAASCRLDSCKILEIRDNRRNCDYLPPPRPYFLPGMLLTKLSMVAGYAKVCFSDLLLEILSDQIFPNLVDFIYQDSRGLTAPALNRLPPACPSLQTVAVAVGEIQSFFQLLPPFPHLVSLTLWNKYGVDEAGAFSMIEWASRAVATSPLRTIRHNAGRNWMTPDVQERLKEVGMDLVLFQPEEWFEEYNYLAEGGAPSDGEDEAVYSEDDDDGLANTVAVDSDDSTEAAYVAYFDTRAGAEKNALPSSTVPDRTQKLADWQYV